MFDNSTHPAVLFLSTKKGVYFFYTFDRQQMLLIEIGEHALDPRAVTGSAGRHLGGKSTDVWLPERSFMENPLVAVQKFGQSIWYDNIRRSLITSGELQGMVDHDGLLGVTSNPAIFEKALAGSTDYDQTEEVRDAKRVATTLGYGLRFLLRRDCT
jgi:hypothetical protein